MTDGKNTEVVVDESSVESKDEHSWENDDYWNERIKQILGLPDTAIPVLLTAGAIEIECTGAELYKELVQRFTGGNNQPFNINFQGDSFYLHIEASEDENWNIEYVTDSDSNDEITTTATEEISNILEEFDADYRNHGGS